MRRLIIFLLANCLLITASLAQATFPPVQTFPVPRSNLIAASSTVAVTNTFQQVFVANVNRLDCMIQNTGTNAMYVFQGAAAGATIATSIKLTAGQAFYCAFNGITYQGEVSITGTATETYYASGA